MRRGRDGGQQQTRPGYRALRLRRHSGAMRLPAAQDVTRQHVARTLVGRVHVRVALGDLLDIVDGAQLPNRGQLELVGQSHLSGGEEDLFICKLQNLIPERGPPF
jgi:hypothetical protein